MCGDRAVTPLDVELAELASKIDSLPKRSLVGLFWACSGALVPEFRAWAAHRGEHTEPLLAAAMAAAHGFAAHGSEPPRAASMLAALEASAPAGDSPDGVSSTSAQDCWICADVGIRVLVDQGYDAGPAIEYALEPVVSAASEELYGVSQLGTSGEEEEQVRVLLQHRKVAAALEFCRWATDFLQDRPSPTEKDLALVSSRASALAP
jgi:hypothetical protein